MLKAWTDVGYQIILDFIDISKYVCVYMYSGAYYFLCVHVL